MKAGPRSSTPQLDHQDAGPSVQVTVERSGLKKGPRGQAAVRAGGDPESGRDEGPPAECLSELDGVTASGPLPGCGSLSLVLALEPRSLCDEGYDFLVHKCPEPTAGAWHTLDTQQRSRSQ